VILREKKWKMLGKIHHFALILPSAGVEDIGSCWLGKEQQQ